MDNQETLTTLAHKIQNKDNKAKQHRRLIKKGVTPDKLGIKPGAREG
jgi:hypothetical protein